MEILNFVYFCYNYPYNFIALCWANNPSLSKHLQGKFKGDVNRFITELDRENQLQLIEWIKDNYNGVR